MELNIAIENSERSFYSGDIIRGKLLFFFNTPKFVLLNGSVNIKFLGRLDWEWRERKFNDNVSKTISKSHIYFEDSCRSGIRKSENESNYNEPNSLEPLDESEYYQEENKYVFPFEYCLPEGLPPSLSSKYGSISYSIEATYRELRKGKSKRTETLNDGKWIISRKAKCTFSVNKTLDLNQLPYLHAEQSMQVKDSRNVCSIFHCKLSPVYATLKIKKCGFALGEEINFTAEIHNMSSRSVENIQIGIVQEVTCTAVIESVVYSHVYRKKIIDVFHKDIFKGDYDNWVGKFAVPIVPPTWKDPEKIIEIRYFVKLSMKIFTLPLQTLELTLPIVIGTIPLRPVNPVHNQTYFYEQNYENYIDEDEFGENENPEVMEAFQIEEEKDHTQYSTLASVQLPLRTISGDVFETERRYGEAVNPVHEGFFPE